MLTRLKKILTFVLLIWALFPLSFARATSGDGLSQLLKTLETTLEQLSSPTRQRRTSIDDLADLRDQLLISDSQIEADFAAWEAQLSTFGLAEEIEQRHIKTVDNYRLTFNTLLDHLDAIETAQDESQLQTHTQQALQFVRQVQPIRSQPRFDPKHPPQEFVAGVQRPPFTTAAELTQWFLGQQADKVSTRRSTREETAQATLSPEIQALAAELDHEPIKIFNWVHDHIDFTPTYGLVQGPEFTLDLKRGNSYDTNVLLANLLQAANIETRYVYGLIELSVARLGNWLGVTKPDEIRQILAKGGIPHIARVAGGQIKSFKLEHFWLEAWIDFIPSQGTKHRQGDTWIPLDASFKHYSLTPGTSLTEQVPFDLEALRTQLLTKAKLDAQSGITGIATETLQTAVDTYQTQLRHYIETNNLDPTEFQSQQQIIPNNLHYFPGGLPYTLIAQSQATTEIPAHLKHSVTVNIYASQSAQGLDNPTVSYTLPLSVLNSQRLNLTYEPASEADAQALAQVRAGGGQKLPLYLFRVKPVLKLEDQILAQGSATGLGQTHSYQLILTDPYHSYPEKGTLTTGDEIVFVVNGNGLTSDMIKKRYAQTPFNSSAAENMYQAGLHFWVAHDLFDHFAAQVYGMRTQRMPSVGTFFIPLSVEYAFFGLPKSGYYQLRQIDVKRNVQVVTVLDDTNSEESTQRRLFKFLSHIGMHGSYLVSVRKRKNFKKNLPKFTNLLFLQKAF